MDMEDIRKPILKKLLRGMEEKGSLRARPSPIPRPQPQPDRPEALKAPSQVANTKPKSSRPAVGSAEHLGLPANMPSAPIGKMVPPNLTKPLDMMKPDGLKRPGRNALRDIIKKSGKQGSY